MAIIKLEDDMTKAELLATQNSNNGYNEMIVDDMVGSIPETGANALVEIWSGSASAGTTITLSESIYNFRMVYVRLTGQGTTIIVPIMPGNSFFRGEGGYTSDTPTPLSYQINGSILTDTTVRITQCNSINIASGAITNYDVSQLYGMR